ncbi:hypothetical protein [uncultured Helicobacter sp.]|uniref:hypothetical protein n=1 Tax=uncultured Helicobacter sp. TaxID=175537 RepID=UPI0037532CEA
MRDSNTKSHLTESKTDSQSPTSKNLIKTLPNINNSACASTMPKQNLKIENL